MLNGSGGRGWPANASSDHPPLTVDDEPEFSNDSMGDPYPYPDFTQLSAVRFSFIAVYVVVIVLSIVGNALVCISVYRNKKMHTAVNYYIVNLAICDLLVGAFVMPVKLLELTAPLPWNILNDPLCTFFMFAQTMFVFSSVLTLVAICVERYFAIVHPLESRMHHSKSRAKRIIFAVWIIPCIVASPHLYPSEATDNYMSSDYGAIERRTCFDSFNEDFRMCYFLFLFVFIYLLPLCFITGTCVRIFRALLLGISFHRQGSLRRQESNRRKVAKMVIVVVLAYALFWSPYFLVTLVTQLQAESFLQEGNFFFTMLCINFLAFTNSCVNPFIYGAMSARFRHGFRAIFLLLCCSLCPSTQLRLSDEMDGCACNDRLAQGKGRLCPLVRSSSTGNNASCSDTPPGSSQDNANDQCRPVLGASKLVNNNVNKYFAHQCVDRGPSVRSAWSALATYACGARSRLRKLVATRPYSNLRPADPCSGRLCPSLDGDDPPPCAEARSKDPTPCAKCTKCPPSSPLWHSSPDVSIRTTADRLPPRTKRGKSLLWLDRLQPEDVRVKRHLSDVISPSCSLQVTSQV